MGTSSPYLHYINSLKVRELLIPNITIHQAIDNLIITEKFNFKIIHPLDLLISHLKLNGVENVIILGTKIHNGRKLYSIKT